MQERRASLRRPGGRGSGLPRRQDPARGARRQPDRRPTEQDPRPDADTEQALDRHVHAGRLRRRQEVAGHPHAAPQLELARPPFRQAGPPPARHDPVRRGPGRHLRGGRHRRLQGHHHARLEPPEEGREVGQGGRHRPQPEGHRGLSQDASASLTPAGSATSRVGASTTPLSGRSTTGPARSWPTSAADRTTRSPAARSSSPSSTSSATAGASPDRRSSRSTT